MHRHTLLLTLVLTAISYMAVAEEQFGRFYTTPGERSRLDELRNNRPREQIKIDISNTRLAEERAPETDPGPAVESIVINGLVYRTDGKNTAWINQKSTNEGSIETQFTNVGEKNISPDQVRIQLDNETDVRMKVGQSYEVITKQVRDIADDPSRPLLSNPSTDADGRASR